MLLTWRIVEIGKVIGRSCAPVYRRIYRVLRAIFVSNRFSTILDVIRRRRLGRGVTVGSRINRKKKNNTRLVMFAIQYPFLHSFFILFFYLFIFFIFFFFYFSFTHHFIHSLFISFVYTRACRCWKLATVGRETDRSWRVFPINRDSERKRKARKSVPWGPRKKRRREKEKKKGKKKGDDE